MLGMAFDIVTAVLVFFLVITFIDVYTAYRQEKELYGLIEKRNDRKDIIRNNKLLKNYNRVIKQLFQERGKEQYAGAVFYLTLGISAFFLIYFAGMKQVFFAVTLPIVFILVMKKIFTMLLDDDTSRIEEELPYVIDNIIKVFSRYGDLKSVMYETSLAIDEPLKSRFDRLSRRMMSGSNQEQALLEFADDINNIWVYSLVFILLSYKEESKKEDVIDNLRHLSRIIEKENNLKTASVTDKKYGVVLNYVIALVAGLGGLANITLNPIGKDYFFGTMQGIIFLIVGYGSVVLTIMINIKLTSKKKGGK